MRGRVEPRNGVIWLAKKGIVWNREGFRRLRLEPKVRDKVNDLAFEVAEAASRQGRGERPKVFANKPGDDNNGYQVTDLVLEKPRGASSVMAVGQAHAHNRKYKALLRGLSEVARG